MCEISRTITFCFNSKTQWQMFNARMGNARMKNSRNLILGEVVYISIIYRIPDSWVYLLNGYDYSFDLLTGENRESMCTAKGQVKRWKEWKMIIIYWEPQTQKMTPYSRDKQNVSERFNFISFCNIEVYEKLSFKRSLFCFPISWTFTLCNFSWCNLGPLI